jgi:hypothetical protein
VISSLAKVGFEEAVDGASWPPRPAGISLQADRTRAAIRGKKKRIFIDKGFLELSG